MGHCKRILRRSLCLLACLVCLLGAVQPVGAIKEPREYVRESVWTANVYYRANTGSLVIGRLCQGTQLTVLRDCGGYYEIDAFGMTGYIVKTETRQTESGYYVNCKDPDNQIKLWQLGDGLLQRSALLQLAQQHLGTPYRYGRSAPGGFDCSGLTSYVYASFDISIHRCADDQMQDGLIVAQEGLQVGDLVFFRQFGSPYLATHVGIYAGDGMMIHADSRGVRYDPVLTGYYGDRYVGARRIIYTEGIEQSAYVQACLGLAGIGK